MVYNTAVHRFCFIDITINYLPSVKQRKRLKSPIIEASIVQFYRLKLFTSIFSHNVYLSILESSRSIYNQPIQNVKLMHILNKKWLRALLSLFAGGLISELIHIAAGNPNREISELGRMMPLFYGLVIYLLLTFYLKRSGRIR